MPQHDPRARKLDHGERRQAACRQADKAQTGDLRAGPEHRRPDRAHTERVRPALRGVFRRSREAAYLALNGMFGFHHTSISVTDADRSQDFYGKFGFREVHRWIRSEEHTSELQSLMRHSYAVFCL